MDIVRRALFLQALMMALLGCGGRASSWFLQYGSSTPQLAQGQYCKQDFRCHALRKFCSRQIHVPHPLCSFNELPTSQLQKRQNVRHMVSLSNEEQKASVVLGMVRFKAAILSCERSMHFSYMQPWLHEMCKEGTVYNMISSSAAAFEWETGKQWQRALSDTNRVATKQSTRCDHRSSTMKFDCFLVASLPSSRSGTILARAKAPRSLERPPHSESESDVRMERVSKVLANRGECSRREADELIRGGHVLVNGEIVELGHKVDAKALVTIDAEGREWLRAKHAIIMNKPRGIISNLPQAGETQASELLLANNVWGDTSRLRDLGDARSFHVAGRLDKDSSGLLVLTADGALAKAIIGSDCMAKTYIVDVEPDVKESQLAKLRGVIELEGVLLRPMSVRLLRKRTLVFVLREGRNRQIRKVCAKFGLRVVNLRRVRVGDIDLGDLPEGRWRFLSNEEVVGLRAAALQTHQD